MPVGGAKNYRSASRRQRSDHQSVMRLRSQYTRVNISALSNMLIIKKEYRLESGNIFAFAGLM